jgi:hypothetical protein
MTEQDDRPRRGLLAAGGPVRTALLIVLAYAVAGAVAGVIWEVVWTPPGQVIDQHQVFYDSYASLRRVFTGTGYYVVVGAATSALVALAVALLARGRELLTLALVVIGSVIAAVVMLKVGTMLGPGDPASVAAHTTSRTQVSGQLDVDGRTPYLIWPMTSLVVLALVFFAWPSSRLPQGVRDTRRADPHEAGISSARDR